MSAPAAAAAASAAAPASQAAVLCAKACSAGNPYAKGGSRAAFVDTIISSNAFTAREPAHKLFVKIATNILNAPAEEKFRKLKSEPVIAKFGPQFVGIAELMRSVGFVTDGAFLVLPASSSLDALCQALCAWSDREAAYQAARAQAERVRAENMAGADADRARKEAARKQVKSLTAQARADVNAKPVVASQGQQIAFGSTLVKAPPPPPPSKGG